VGSVLAAIAAVTDKVTIGPLVAATSFHSPAMLAKKAAALHEISQGRFVLGLGAGWNEIDYRAFGFAYHHRVSRFEEAFTIIRQLLDGKKVSFNGTYYAIENCELLPVLDPPKVPLMVGSTGPRMLEITLPHVKAWNAWFTSFGNTPGGLRKILSDVQVICDRLYVDYDALSKSVAVLVQAPGGMGRNAGDVSSQIPSPLVGSRDQLVESLVKFYALGIDEVQLVLDPITIDSIAWCGEIIRQLP